MSFSIRFSKEAITQLDLLEQYIADAGSPTTAARYVDAIVAYCEGLTVFPQRRAQRSNLFEGLRITHYRKRTVIAFLVDDAAEIISIVGIFYGGQDYESLFEPSSDDSLSS
jgi:plasmid stabilization system protein ParE